MLNDRVLEKAYEAYLGVREPELEAVELDPAPYLGRYEARMADVELAETEAGLELRFIPKGGFPTPETPPVPAPPPATGQVRERGRALRRRRSVEGRAGSLPAR